MMSTCVKLSSLITHISAATKFLEEEIQSYTLPEFMVQNSGSSQEKQIPPQILKFTK